MGIKHKQARRYLNKLKALRWIHTTNQYNLDGLLEYRIAPDQYLMPSPGEKYFMFNMKGCGKKGFDIYAMLERALAEDSHPAERDTGQLSFAISERTRRWRKNRHESVKSPRPYLLATQGDRQKVTPIAEDNPVHSKNGQNTTLPAVKNSKEKLWLKMTHKDRYKVPWHTLRRLSEFQKIRAGLANDARAVWHRGRVFGWNTTTGAYEFLAKQASGPVAKSDPTFCKTTGSLIKNRWQKVTPVPGRAWPECGQRPERGAYSSTGKARAGDWPASARGAFDRDTARVEAYHPAGIL